jgi:dUTP pyrophosphatase
LRPVLHVKRLSDEAYLPSRGTADSAGLDLFTTESKVLHPGETLKFATDLAVRIPQGYAGLVRPRSSAFLKAGLDVNGTIDSDYRGHVWLLIRNASTQNVFIDREKAYAQLIIVPYLDVSVVEVDELSNTERGEGGLGSTGNN